MIPSLYKDRNSNQANSKKYLAQRPCNTIEELGQILNEFRRFYNQDRPHRALGRKTPGFAYTLIPKAAPATPTDPGIWHVRYDIIDESGSITLRYAGKLRHLGIGRAHARTEIICLVHNQAATVITHTGEVLAEFTINTEKDYQRKNT